jgi:hypothetical protein
VPKHRVGPEEHEVRVCLRSHLGGNDLMLTWDRPLWNIVRDAVSLVLYHSLAHPLPWFITFFKLLIVSIYHF